MSVLIVNKENFNSVRTNEKPVLLDFYADWCGPCSMVSPIIDKIAEENPQYVVGKINVDSEQELARTFKVFVLIFLNRFYLMTIYHILFTVSVMRSRFLLCI